MRVELTAVVNSGATLSGIIDLTQLAGIRSIKIPANVTSGNLFIQGASDTVSASFARVQNANPNSGDLQFSTVGSVAAGVILSAPNELGAPGFAPYVRLQFSNAQTDTRTIAMLAARW